jgi:hypothetical protein
VLPEGISRLSYNQKFYTFSFFLAPMKKAKGSSQIQKSITTGQAGTSRHVYEVDVLHIYQLLKKRADQLASADLPPNVIQSHAELLERLKLALEILGEKHGIDLSDDNNAGKTLVLTPQEGAGDYSYWLGLFLIAQPFKTSMILQYHFERWRDKRRFLGYIEFHMINQLLPLTSLDNSETLAELRQWLKDKRAAFMYFKLQETQEKASADQGGEEPKIIQDTQTKSDNTSPEMGSSQPAIEEPYTTDSTVHPEKGEKEKSHTDDIVNGKVTIPNNVQDALWEVLQNFVSVGKEKFKEALISTEFSCNPIEVNLSANVLVDIFVQLIKANEIYSAYDVLIARWIGRTFKTVNKKNKGSYTTIKESYIADILCGYNKPSKRIRIKILSENKAKG